MRLATRLCLVLSQVACFSEGSSGSASDEDSTSSPDTATDDPTDPATTDPETTDPTTDPSTEPTVSGPTTNDDGVTEDATSEPTTMTSADASSDDGDDTGEQCPPDSRFIPPVPVGWDGVFALAPETQSGEPAMCPPAMPAGDHVLEGPESSCECTCDPGCWVNGFDVLECSDDPVDFDSGYDDTCMSFGSVDPLHISLVFDDLASDGNCNGPEAVATIVADARYLECLHVSGEPCIPVPMAPDFHGPCISYDDEVPCPAGPYSERHVVAAGADPGCGGCTSCMTDAIEACNAASAILYPETACGGRGVEVVDTTCSSDLGRSVELDVSLACPAPPTFPPTLQGVRTFCCVP